MASDGGIKHDVGSAKSRQADHPGVLVFLEADLLQIVLNYVFDTYCPDRGTMRCLTTRSSGLPSPERCAKSQSTSAPSV
jgi:hypothetical protein